MQKDFISRLLSYYRNSPKFDDEISRALKEFFSEGLKDVFDEMLEPYFNEWLIFDFKLKNGMTLLEDYYDRNPHKLPMYQLQVCKNLQNNIYGMFEVKQVDVGEGMELLLLSTGEKYYVNEYLGTFDLKKGNVFFNRISKVGDYYEMVGANSFMFDIKLTPSFRKILKSSDEKMTPLDALRFSGLGKSKEGSNRKKARDNNLREFDLSLVLSELDTLFEKVGISKMINANLVYKWITKIDFKNKIKSVPIIFTINNLIQNPDENEENMREITNLITEIFNNVPDSKIKGKTPAEKLKELGDDYVPSHKVTFSKGGKFWDYLEKSSKYMTSGEPRKSIEYFDKTFQQLLKEETTHFDVFRFLANKAVCHVLLSEFYLAKKVNDLALKLNKNYDFAIDVKEKIKKIKKDDSRSTDFVKKIRQNPEVVDHYAFGDLKSRIDKLSDLEIVTEYNRGYEKYQKRAWKYDPARIYCEFLDKLEINFESEGLTESVRMNIGEK